MLDSEWFIWRQIDVHRKVLHSSWHAIVIIRFFSHFSTTLKTKWQVQIKNVSMTGLFCFVHSFETLRCKTRLLLTFWMNEAAGRVHQISLRFVASGVTFCFLTGMEMNHSRCKLMAFHVELWANSGLEYPFHQLIGCVCVCMERPRFMCN